MKLINILILMLTCMGQIASAQVKLLDKKITVSCTDLSGKEFLEYLRKEQNIQFSYSDNLISQVKGISLNLSDAPLLEVLKQAFKGAGVEFTEIGGQILLKKSPAPAKVEPKPKAAGAAIKPMPQNPEIREKYEEASVQMQASETEEELEEVYLNAKTELYSEYIAIKEDTSTQEIVKNDLKTALRALKQDLEELRDSINASKAVASLKEATSKPLFPAKKQADTVVAIPKTDTTRADGTVPVQVSFVPPMSTNGMKNSESVNMFSLNILAGYSKGLSGLEIGSIANVDREKVSGAQFSGLANVVGKDVKGVQAAGFTNIAGERVVGAQLAGFLNMAGDTSHALQAAGFYNQVTGTNTGGQFAGFMNLATGSHYGPQGAGFMNITGGNSLGLQAAGFTNITTGTMEGMQASGFLNYARKTSGAQIGVLNVTGRLKGTQIGVFNFADSAQGAQIGFLSFTRKGYHKLELGTNELWFNTLSFKTGTRAFYNILSAGVKFIDENDLAYTYGYGLGGEIGLSRKFFIAIEGVCYQADDTRISGHDLNLFANSRLLFGFTPTKKLSLAAGPTFNGNFMLAHPDDYAAYSMAPENTVYTNRWNKDFDNRDSYLSLWPGFYGAVSFNF